MICRRRNSRCLPGYLLCMQPRPEEPRQRDTQAERAQVKVLRRCHADAFTRHSVHSTEAGFIVSTASPLVLPEHETTALKQQVTDRLRVHRQKRARGAETQAMLPMEDLAATRRHSPVADSVAARFASSMSYREFLRQEAEAAMAQAAAIAEVARRNAEAVAFVQQDLLEELHQETAAGEMTVPHLVTSTPAVDPETAGDDQAPGGTSPSSQDVFDATLEEFALTDMAVPAEACVLALPVEPSVPLPANLIEFPRQLVAARRARPRLAEGPLRDEADAAPEQAQLRIFEVEANSVSTTPDQESILPEWHDIHLDASADAQAASERVDARSSTALPLYVAPVELRAMAAIVDGCCVVAALLLAVVVAAYASPVLPTGMFAAASAAGALGVFSVLYLVLFFTLDDATPGMRYARIGFCTFADENPTRASIRRRILALFLATLPLGLGLLWACMDEDGLGWHDRITRMYPRAY